MIKLNQIPPAALEAGREAFLECDVNPSYSFDDVLSAAFLAMLKAWTGMIHGKYFAEPSIILPLLQENSNDQ